MTGSFMDRGKQYIELVKVLYCKLPTKGKQLPAFPLVVWPGFELRSQRWEARVLPLYHCGPCLERYIHGSCVGDRIVQYYNIHRFLICLLVYPNKPIVQEILAFSHPRPIPPIRNSTVWPVHCSNGIHASSQGSQTDGSKIRVQEVTST